MISMLLELQLIQEQQIKQNNIMYSDYYKEEELQYCQQQGYTPVSNRKQIIIKNIFQIKIGQDKIKPWYFSPYYFPNIEFVQTLHICPFCLKYTLQEELMQKHLNFCTFKNTFPGVKIYDDDHIKVYEVDGRCEKLFCQNICLFSRLFLQGKTCFYSTNNFIFYLFVSNKYNKDENDKQYNIVGYFSKAKTSQNTLSCILTFPQYMKMGLTLCQLDMKIELVGQKNHQVIQELRHLKNIINGNYLKQYQVVRKNIQKQKIQVLKLELKLSVQIKQLNNQYQKLIIIKQMYKKVQNKHKNILMNLIKINIIGFHIQQCLDLRIRKIQNINQINNEFFAQNKKWQKKWRKNKKMKKLINKLKKKLMQNKQEEIQENINKLCKKQQNLYYISQLHQQYYQYFHQIIKQ